MKVRILLILICSLLTGYSMKEDQQARIFQKLSQQQGWERSIAYQQYFNIVELNSDKGLKVKLTYKGLSQLNMTVTFSENDASYQNSGLIPPRLPELSKSERLQFDEILSENNFLILISPQNNELHPVDLTVGYQQLILQQVFQERNFTNLQIITTISNNIACSFYISNNSLLDQKVFFICLNMESRKILEADLIPELWRIDRVGVSSRLSEETINFINSSLKTNGKLTTDEDLTIGLIKLLKIDTVTLSYDDKEKQWILGFAGINNNGHNLKIIIDAHTGEILNSSKLFNRPDNISPAPMTMPSNFDINTLGTDLLSFPELTGKENTLDLTDIKFINHQLSDSVGSLGKSGIESLYSDFTIKRIPNNKEYQVQLNYKHGLRLTSTFYISKYPMSTRIEFLKLSNGIELNSAEIKKVDVILKKYSELWMSTPSNHNCIIYDLTKGYKKLNTQNIFPNNHIQDSSVTIKIQRNDDVITLCYQNDEWVAELFCITIDLNSKTITSANWYSIPMEDGFWLTSKDIIFINSSLENSSETFLNGNKSLQSIYEENSLSISHSQHNWWLEITPKQGSGYLLGFSIDKRTGEIGQPLTGDFTKH